MLTSNRNSPSQTVTDHETYSLVDRIRDAVHVRVHWVHRVSVSSSQRRLPLHEQRAVKRALRTMENVSFVQRLEIDKVIRKLRKLQGRHGGYVVQEAIEALRRSPSSGVSEYSARADEHIRAAARMGTDLRSPSALGIQTRVVQASRVRNRPDLDAEEKTKAWAAIHDAMRECPTGDTADGEAPDDVAGTSRCASPKCIEMGVLASNYYHLIAATETEIAEREGREPRPIEPGECPNARNATAESRAMVEQILASSSRTSREELLRADAGIGENAEGTR
jgi:hypothetical protein